MFAVFLQYIDFGGNSNKIFDFVWELPSSNLSNHLRQRLFPHHSRQCKFVRLTHCQSLAGHVFKRPLRHPRCPNSYIKSKKNEMFFVKTKKCYIFVSKNITLN